jgi:hypothetical protein
MSSDLKRHGGPLVDKETDGSTKRVKKSHNGG